MTYSILGWADNPDVGVAALHRLACSPGEPSGLVPIGPELAVELTGLMAAHGAYDRAPDGTWDAAARRRWELFRGSENDDNRINDGTLLDLEVLADLRRRYGRRPVG